MSKTGLSPSSIILVDKPLDFTSFDVVACVRGALKTAAVGHLGTLDPKATGLLVLFSGGATKLIQYFMGLDKRYSAEITFGGTTPTDDSETEPSATPGCPPPPSLQDIETLVTSRFTGTIQQVPPIYSAVKIKGCPAYKLARRGKAADIEPRTVTIHSFDMIRYEYPVLTVNCRVSSGAYIRSLARDLGAALGTGAYLSALRRSQVGQWRIEDAVGVKPLPLNAAVPVSTALRGILTQVDLNAAQVEDLMNGIFVEEADVKTIEVAGRDRAAEIGNNRTDRKPLPFIGVHNGQAAFILERRLNALGRNALKPAGRL
ncbi:MAG: tRNA pseudouridine(55) synthase TruB [Planctomycetota bacterium]